MFLGRLAVGLIIFVLVSGAIIWLYDAVSDAKDVTGWMITLSLVMGTYCTISGLYLLIHFGYL